VAGGNERGGKSWCNRTASGGEEEVTEDDYDDYAREDERGCQGGGRGRAGAQEEPADQPPQIVVDLDLIFIKNVPLLPPPSRPSMWVCAFQGEPPPFRFYNINIKKMKMKLIQLYFSLRGI
jgi:hypothetical protein